MRLPKRFDISQSALETYYKSLQRKLHPDRFTSRPKDIIRYSEQLSAYVNECVHTLRDDIQRARTLLRMLNAEYDGRTDGTDDDVTTNEPLDPTVLEFVMNVRWSLEDIRDGTAERSQIDDIRRRNDQWITRIRRGLSDEFESIESSAPSVSEPSLRRVRALIAEYSYADAIQREIDSLSA